MNRLVNKLFWDEDDMRWFGVLAVLYFSPTIAGAVRGEIEFLP